MDPLNDNVASLLNLSTDKFVSELWKDGESRQESLQLRGGGESGGSGVQSCCCIGSGVEFILSFILLPSGGPTFVSHLDHSWLPSSSFLFRQRLRFFPHIFLFVGSQRYHNVKEPTFISVSLFCTRTQVMRTSFSLGVSCCSVEPHHFSVHVSSCLYKHLSLFDLLDSLR